MTIHTRAIAAVAAATMFASCSAGAVDLSGKWRSDQFGYLVVIEQKDDTIRAIAGEDYPLRGYDTLREGDVILSGRISGNTIVGEGILFTHEQTMAKCGFGARNRADARLELSADGNALRGTDSAWDVTGNGCEVKLKSFPVSLTRIATAPPGSCPQVEPIAGRQGSSTDIVKHYMKYISGILTAEANATLGQVGKRVGYGYEMYKVLKQQLSILDATRVPAMMHDSLPLLSLAVKQQQGKTTDLTAIARTVFRASKDSLAGAAMCVGRAADNDRFYEINLYAVDKATCNALRNSGTAVAEAVRVNGGAANSCESDVVVDWRPWERAGRNQVTLVINPYSMPY